MTEKRRFHRMHATKTPEVACPELPCLCTQDLHNLTLKNRVSQQNTLHTPDSSRDDKDGGNLVAGEEGNFSRASIVMSGCLARGFLFDALFVLTLPVLLISWPFSLRLSLSEHISHFPVLAFTSMLHLEHLFATKLCV